ARAHTEPQRTPYVANHRATALYVFQTTNHTKTPTLSLHDALPISSTRAAADTQLQSNITSETNRATSAENTLTTNLNSEVSRATSEEHTSGIKLGYEAVARVAADTTLGASIVAETTRATGAESTLT